MKSRVKLLRAAENDIALAFDYYEGKKEHLGFEFVQEVDRTIQRIAEHPLAHRKVIEDARRAMVDRFPYGVWYRLKEDGSVVIACLHHSRDLKHIRKRLRGPEPS